MRPGYTYVATLSGNKRYVGSTTNVNRRVAQHKSGRGAVAVRGHTITRVSVKRHASIKAARAAETRLYYKMANRHGRANVRGAGHTKRFKRR